MACTFRRQAPPTNRPPTISPLQEPITIPPPKEVTISTSPPTISKSPLLTAPVSSSASRQLSNYSPSPPLSLPKPATPSAQPPPTPQTHPASPPPPATPFPPSPSTTTPAS